MSEEQRRRFQSGHACLHVVTICLLLRSDDEGISRCRLHGGMRDCERATAYAASRAFQAVLRCFQIAGFEEYRALFR